MLTDLTYFSLKDFPLGQSWRVSRLPWVRGVTVGEFVIPCDFFVVDMEESPHMPIILGRPFLATAGAGINVQASTLCFCICGERVDFCFSPPTSTYHLSTSSSTCTFGSS